jgi:hypothetical protein
LLDVRSIRTARLYAPEAVACRDREASDFMDRLADQKDRADRAGPALDKAIEAFAAESRRTR